MPHGKLVLVRHGESLLNKLNRFTGWLDVPLSEVGIKEAEQAAVHCRGFEYDACFTSHLERAHETLLVILARQKKIGVFVHQSSPKYNITSNTPKDFLEKIIPIYTTRDLNERAYGLLQGMDKKVVAQKYGEEQVYKWRRGFDDKPPRGESLRQVFERVIPYFEENIHSRVKEGQNILISGHGNTLRAIIKYLEKIDDKKIPFIDLPFGHPFVYTCKRGIFSRTEGEFNYNRPLR